MNLTTDHKKALFIFGSGLLLFWIFKPKMKKVTADTKLNFSNDEENPKDRKKMDVPTLSSADAKDPMVRNSFGALNKSSYYA